MSSRKIVFILGAGASKEANLPTGYELKSKIAHLLDIRFESMGKMVSGDYTIYQAFQRVARESPENTDEKNPNVYIQAGWRIRDAMPQALSIDNFIDQHIGDKRIELAGKLAIVSSILKAEQNSSLHFDRTRGANRLDVTKMEKTWFNSFFQLLVQNCKIDQLEDRLTSVVVINFNYDRCVEHYLFHGLQNYYAITPDAAAKLVGKISIFHPYGTVGSLPWQSSDLEIDFGAEPNSEQLLRLVPRIKTFTEGTDPSSSSIAGIRESMRTFNLLVGLGFAFHDLNLQLLQPNTSPARKPEEMKVYATGKGISPSDCEAIRDDLVALLGVQPSVLQDAHELTCRQLFDANWRRLIVN